MVKAPMSKILPFFWHSFQPMLHRFDIGKLGERIAVIFRLMSKESQIIKGRHFTVIDHLCYTLPESLNTTCSVHAVLLGTHPCYTLALREGK